MLKTVIVEDDRMVAAINAQFAEKTPGVQVVATFHNGRDALAFLEQTSVDLVLTDLYMPELSGIELVEELRRRGCNAEVIFITAANDFSKVTVRRYLNYLIGTGEAESQVDYSTGGRPRVEYRSR